MNGTYVDIGCGYKKLPGFIRVDGDPNCKPDHLVNLDDVNLVLPFEDSSVDGINASHILEHIGAGYFRLLQEIYRVCKPGALIKICVPHPNHEVYLNDPTHKRPITAEGIRLFSKAFNQEEISRGGSSSTLGLMYNVDFELVDVQYIHDGFYDDIKPKLTQFELQRLFREALNVCIEIHMLVRVIK